jgi:PAS domain S-box-containing protein
MLPTGKSAVSSDQSVVLRYAGAAMASLAALGVRMALDPILGSQAPYLPFVIAIVVASRYGGRGPGLAATAISGLAVDWFYLQPRGSLVVVDPNAAAALALFFLTGVIISFVVGRLRKSLLSADSAEPAPRPQEDSPGSAMPGRGAGRKLKPHHLWLGAAALLLAIEALLFLGTWTRFAERESLSIRAREVLARIESLLSELKDAETGQRGYLLTGQDSYLAPYNAAVQAIPGQLEDLGRQTLDPGQQARIVSLRPLIAAKLAELRETIDLKRAGGAAAALQALSSDRGKQTMDQIRDAIAAMQAAEASLLEARSQRAAAAARGMGFVMASGAGLLFILLLAGARDIDRNLTRRQQAQEKLRESDERYRTLFNTLIEGFCIIEVIFDAESRPVDYRFLEINEAFEGQTGLKNARGRLMRDLAPEHEVHWFEIYGRVALTGQPAHFVNEARALGRWYEVNAYRVGEPERRRVAILFSDISERKRAEEKIRASEEKFARAFATNPAALAITRIEDGVTIEVNETWQAMMGHSRDEAIGRSTFDLHTWQTPEDRARYAKDLREKGSITDREVTLLRESGEPFTALLSAVILPVAGEDVALSAWLDISDRKRAEEAVRESEARFRRLYESGMLGVIFWNLDGAILDANDKFLEITGYDRDDLAAGHIDWVHMTPPEYRPLDEASVEELKATGVNAAPFEKEYIRKDGSRVPIIVTGAMLDDARYNGVALAVDITQRKRSEEALLRMSAMVESSDDAIIGKTLEGAITSWNLGAARMYGYSAPEVIGHHISVLVPADHPDEIAAILGRLVSGARVEQFEAVHRRRDGSLVDVSLKISPIVDASGNVVGASMIARDITERKRAEEEIRRLNADLEDRVRRRTAQLEAANKELEAFAYSVSHDLRTPLRGIDGWSLALVEDYASQLDEKALGYVDRLRAETQRMGMLIDDLLQLSRVTRSEMAAGAVDLTAIARRIAARLAEGNSGRRIEFTIAGGLAASGDARLLEIVLENLFGNAVKFTGPRAEARIEFGRAEGDGERPFYVRDNGVGFDMAFASTLFGAFQRLHRASEFPGTGIGLATVQRIIHRHGGRVWAEAQPDRGATFYFTLGGS